MDFLGQDFYRAIPQTEPRFNVTLEAFERILTTERKQGIIRAPIQNGLIHFTL